LRKGRIAALILLQSIERQLKSATTLNMTAAPGMRDLAHRLHNYEADAGKTSEPMESPTLRVYEKLRQSLGEFVGVAGFQSLASRALTLAKPEAPSLSAAQVAADGSLQGLGKIETQIDMDKDQAGEGGIILIARLLGLLRTFLGEALTLTLLRNAWPGEVFDDRNSVHGRKA
jgi:hypothetical protein